MELFSAVQTNDTQRVESFMGYLHYLFYKKKTERDFKSNLPFPRSPNWTSRQHCS